MPFSPLSQQGHRSAAPVPQRTACWVLTTCPKSPTLGYRTSPRAQPEGANSASHGLQTCQGPA